MIRLKPRGARAQASELAGAASVRESGIPARSERDQGTG